MIKPGHITGFGLVLLVLLAADGQGQQVAAPEKGGEPGLPAREASLGPQDSGSFLLGRPSLLLESAPGQAPAPLDAQARPRGQFDHADRADGPWGSLNAHLLVHDPRGLPDEPILGDRWQTDEALKLSVAGPVFLFGQWGAGFDTLTTQQRRVTSRTGLGCRLVPCQGTEIEFHGGPALTRAEDPLRPEQLPHERATMLLELQCRCPLAGPVHLEYQGTAVPAISPLDRNHVDHDLRLAVPLGATGNFRLGARCHWEDASTPRPLTDTMEFYLGFGLNR